MFDKNVFPGRIDRLDRVRRVKQEESGECGLLGRRGEGFRNRGLFRGVSGQ